MMRCVVAEFVVVDICYEILWDEDLAGFNYIVVAFIVVEDYRAVAFPAVKFDVV